MCEVTNSNFQVLYPEIEKALQDATFIAVDSEFSGLISSDNLKNSLFDSASERYMKLKQRMGQFIVIQIGITAFRFIRDKNQYSAKIYTFYLFPQSFALFDTRFLCQSSSFEFLCKHNFDFNKFVYQGVPYLRQKEAEQLRMELAKGNLLDQLETDILLEKELRRHCECVAEWESSAETGQEMSIQSPWSLHLCYLLHSQIRLKFKSLWTVSRPWGIGVKKVSKEEKINLSQNAGLNGLGSDMLDSLLGFSKVFWLLSDLKKPIIGHNLLLDLLLLYNQFYEPLPNEYSKFKRNLHLLFPLVYDTKFLSYELKKQLKKGDQWEQNSLDALYTYFKAGRGAQIALYSPSCQIEDGVDVDDEISKLHEAGWDSYFTGFCFIRMAHIMASQNYGESCCVRPLSSVEHLAAVRPFSNKVNIVKATINHLNLGGNDPVSTRPKLFHVTRRGKNRIDVEEVTYLFERYGALDVKVHSRQSVLVAVGNHGIAKDIMRAFKGHKGYRVVLYNPILHSPTFQIVLCCGTHDGCGVIITT